MQAGGLRHRVILQALVNTPDTSGGNIESWVNVATVWAKVEPIQGREFWAAQQANTSLDTVVTIRYLEGITPLNHVLFGARVFKIHAVINPSEGRRELQLMCEEVITSA